MSDFGLIKSFDIDNGELDGFQRHECFVFGYELADVDHQLKSEAKAISRPVHAANRERIVKSCQDSGREFKLTWLHEDGSEEWMQLDVAPRS